MHQVCRSEGPRRPPPRSPDPVPPGARGPWRLAGRSPPLLARAVPLPSSSFSSSSSSSSPSSSSSSCSKNVPEGPRCAPGGAGGAQFGTPRGTQELDALGDQLFRAPKQTQRSPGRPSRSPGGAPEGPQGAPGGAGESPFGAGGGAQRARPAALRRREPRGRLPKPALLPARRASPLRGPAAASRLSRPAFTPRPPPPRRRRAAPPA